MQVKAAVVVGAGHGIGLGFAQAIRARHPLAAVLATYRNSEKASALLAAAQADAQLTAIQLDAAAADAGTELQREIAAWQGERCRLHLAINAVGMLHDGAHQPEKRLAQCQQQALLESFRINAVVTPLLAAALHKFFRHPEPSSLATVSAKVGSIEDNGLGGWYGYRASKAALNMFLRNIALEYRRTNCATRVLGLHPGTVSTDLSAPFRGGVQHEIFSVEKSVGMMLDVLESGNEAQHGRLVAYDGTVIPF